MKHSDRIIGCPAHVHGPCGTNDHGTNNDRTVRPVEQERTALLPIALRCLEHLLARLNDSGVGGDLLDRRALHFSAIRKTEGVREIGRIPTGIPIEIDAASDSNRILLRGQTFAEIIARSSA
jgi:hypothetical protein